jgi:hypothetical protein
VQIPANWERLACSKGSDYYICTGYQCLEKALNAAKQELSGMSTQGLTKVLLKEESLLLREAAAEALGDLGAAAASSAAPALFRMLRHQGWKDSRHGSSQHKPLTDDIKTMHTGPDGTAHIWELAAWRTLRIKAAQSLAKMGCLGELTEGLLEERPVVREAAAMGLAALPPDIAADATDAVPLLSRLLSDECEKVRGAAAVALKAFAPSGIAKPAIPELKGALKMPFATTCGNTSTLVTSSKRRRWKDTEAMLMFKQDVVDTLGILGEVVEYRSTGLSSMDMTRYSSFSGRSSSFGGSRYTSFGSTSELRRTASGGSELFGARYSTKSKYNATARSPKVSFEAF